MFFFYISESWIYFLKIPVLLIAIHVIDLVINALSTKQRHSFFLALVCFIVAIYFFPIREAVGLLGFLLEIIGVGRFAILM